MNSLNVQLGQRVYLSQYGGRSGIVTAIYGEDGVENNGGQVTFDIYFTDLTRNLKLPESVAKMSQWNFDYASPLATEQEIELSILSFDIAQAEKAEQKKRAARIFKQRVESIKADDRFKHLSPVSEKYSVVETAKNIRKHLKFKYPNSKFSVKALTGKGSIVVAFKSGGFDTAFVEEELMKFKVGNYDAFQNYYISISPFNQVFGCVTYIYVS